MGDLEKTPLPRIGGCDESIVTDFRLMQLQNATSLINTIDSGMVTSLRFEQERKAPLPMNINGFINNYILKIRIKSVSSIFYFINGINFFG